MALTLRTAITANDTVFDVLGTDPIVHGQLKSLGDEYVYIRTASVGSPNFGEAAYWRLGVERGTLGTTAASHAAALTLGAVDLTASPGGGGSLSVTDGTTTVAGATSLSVPKGSLSEPSSGVAAVGGLLVAETALSNAQIKGLGSGTVVDVVPAPGVGKVVVPFLAFITVDAVAAPYTAINASATIQLAYNDGADASTTINETYIQVSTLLGADGEITFGTVTSRSGLGSGAVYDASEGENLALGLSGWNGGDGDFTGGDAANSGRVKVFYTIEDLP